jgi:hypothetical protein
MLFCSMFIDARSTRFDRPCHRSRRRGLNLPPHATQRRYWSIIALPNTSVNGRTSLESLRRSLMAARYVMHRSAANASAPPKIWGWEPTAPRLLNTPHHFTKLPEHRNTVFNRVAYTSKFIWAPLKALDTSR